MAPCCALPQGLAMPSALPLMHIWKDLFTLTWGWGSSGKGPPLPQAGAARAGGGVPGRGVGGLGPVCGAGMMSTPHSLVNVYEQGGLGLGAPWSQQAAAPSWPILPPLFWGAWQVCFNIGGWPTRGLGGW